MSLKGQALAERITRLVAGIYRYHGLARGVSIMNIYLAVILAILIGNYILNFLVEILNIFSAKIDLSGEFKTWYDENEYKKSQKYLRDNTYFGLIHSTAVLFIFLFLILSGGFNFVDHLARGFNLGVIPTGLVFAGMLFLGFQLIDIPFSVYQTFIIEEKYGFNRTTPKIFLLDLMKSWMLTAIIGGIVFSGVMWFFIKTGEWAWIWCWFGVTGFQLFLIFIMPVVILPLFNKFVPLKEGELRETIQNYANSQKFAMKGLFTMDGSKLSTKANAFFIGFGKYRRIVLYDTLIENHTIDELVSILAHEMGHYKKKHILKHMIVSIITAGLMFFILSLFINNPGLFEAFKMEKVSIYASLFFFGFIYTPINMIISILSNFFSRKHEYEADMYAVTTYNKPEAFISALKRLSIDNLSNLTPHPLKVFFDYSHPPVLKRIEFIRKSL